MKIHEKAQRVAGIFEAHVIVQLLVNDRLEGEDDQSGFSYFGIIYFSHITFKIRKKKIVKPYNLFQGTIIE